MKKTSIVWAASFFLIIALSAWGAQRTFTTYTWDGEVDVAPADAAGQFEIKGIIYIANPIRQLLKGIKIPLK